MSCVRLDLGRNLSRWLQLFNLSMPRYFEASVSYALIIACHVVWLFRPAVCSLLPLSRSLSGVGGWNFHFDSFNLFSDHIVLILTTWLPCFSITLSLSICHYHTLAKFMTICQQNWKIITKHYISIQNREFL